MFVIVDNDTYPGTCPEKCPKIKIYFNKYPDT